MSTKNFSYEIVSIDDTTMDYIKSRLEEGKSLVKSIKETGITPEHIAWVKSFSTVITMLDPLGEDYSGSLYSEWFACQWYAGNQPKNNDEYTIVFGQYLAVVQSLMFGKVKIVKSKNNNVSAKYYVFNQCVDLHVDPNLVFVLMPFVEKWSNYIWTNQIKPIVENMEGYNFQCRRADELHGHDVLMDIYKSIASASIIIADITNKNVNVFYELGIAHTLGKDVILLTQDIKSVPFDVNRFRIYRYSNDGEGYDILKKEIPSAIKDILSKR